MKRTSSELKRMSRETLNGRYNLPMSTVVLTNLIVSVVSYPFSRGFLNNPGGVQTVIYALATFFISLLSVLLSCGIYKIHLNMSRGIKTSLGELFFAFRQRPDRYLLCGLLFFAIMFVCAIPFMVCLIIAFFASTLANTIVFLALGLAFLTPVIIVSLIYGQIYFLMIDYPEMKVTNAFKESRRMMLGNKGRLFYISLSFIGWIPIILLSFGVAVLWILPYRTQVSTKFYLELTGELDRTPQTDPGQKQSSTWEARV